MVIFALLTMLFLTFSPAFSLPATGSLTGWEDPGPDWKFSSGTIVFSQTFQEYFLVLSHFNDPKGPRFLAHLSTEDSGNSLQLKDLGLSSLMVDDEEFLKYYAQKYLYSLPQEHQNAYEMAALLAVTDQDKFSVILPREADQASIQALSQLVPMSPYRSPEPELQNDVPEPQNDMPESQNDEIKSTSPRITSQASRAHWSPEPKRDRKARPTYVSPELFKQLKRKPGVTGQASVLASGNIREVDKFEGFTSEGIIAGTPDHQEKKKTKKKKGRRRRN